MTLTGPEYSPTDLVRYESENTPWTNWSSPFAIPVADQELIRQLVISGILKPLSGTNVDGMNVLLNSYVLTEAGREKAGLPPLVKPEPERKQKSLFDE